MKILSVTSLSIPEIQVVRLARFGDHRGYFAEPYRKSDVQSHPELGALKGLAFVQTNESFSKSGTIRGLHFQWNPFMGKLVRTLTGRMVDLALDIRPDAPTHGKLIAYDMPYSASDDFCEWIWIPPGFAHGNYFTEPSQIEYFCTGEYSPNCEAGISPFADDIDWSLCDPMLKEEFEGLREGALVSDKDRDAQSLRDWMRDSRSNQFRELQIAQ